MRRLAPIAVVLALFVITPVQAGVTSNGLNLNGLNANGLNLNGLNLNGLNLNGLPAAQVRPETASSLLTTLRQMAARPFVGQIPQVGDEHR